MKVEGIIGAGNWITDHLKIIDQFPHQDGLANILVQTTGNGGAAYNVLKDLSLLGFPYPLKGIGLIGNDANGQAILQDCKRLNIQTNGLLMSDELPTSYTDVMTVKSSGRRTFFHHRGANAAFSAEGWTPTNLSGRILHLGYLLLLDALDELQPDGSTKAARLLEKAKLAGLQTSVDIVSESSYRFSTVVPPALPFTDYLFLNEYEAGRITDTITTHENGATNLDGVILAAQKLLTAGVQQWVFLHFPEGALAAGKNGTVHWQGKVNVPAKKIVGTAGAGDAFAAGVLYGLHENWAIQTCLEAGVSVAAASLFSSSCSDSILPLEDCLMMGSDFGFFPLTGQHEL